MQIKVNGSSRVRLKYLSFGDWFIWNGMLYVVILTPNAEHFYVTALDVLSKKRAAIVSTEEVEPVDVNITVKRRENES